MAQSTQIHPTAVIEEGAVIGEGCVIGPYCVIGPEVVMGKGNVLHAHVMIDGKTELGDENEIYQFASIGAKTQDLKYTEEPTYAKIGDRNTFREYVTIHRGTSPGQSTVLGSDCNLLAYSHVAHDCVVGNGVIMSNAVSLAGHVQVGDRAIVGGMSGIHQFCRIGSGAMVGATSKIVQDVLPFCIADGGPAATRIINKVGLERAGKSKETIRAVTQTFKLIFRSGLNLDEAIEKATAEYGQFEEVQTMLTFAKESERGLAR